MPERIRLDELRLTDYNGNEADLSASAATLILENEAGSPHRWEITADIDQVAYFDPVASFYNARMVTGDGRTFKGEVSLMTLNADTGRTAAIVLVGNGELLSERPPSQTR